ncbi:MAG: MotA/TolQ/ExbB proton channel family protein [Smithella sp.]
MNILAGLETFLYLVSSVLLYPVVVALVLLIFWVLLSFGGFLREWIDRRKNHFSPVTHYLIALKESFRTASDPRHLDIIAERILQEEELKLVKSLDRIRFVIRTGPALGLMGTLIPMGISLSSLAKGDMPQMAGSMVTAFTTVVVGLACSVVAYLMALVKEKWVRADMRELECATELLLRKTNGRSLPETKEEPEDAVS